MLEGLQELDKKLANSSYITLPVTGVAMAAFAGVMLSPSLRRQVELARTHQTATSAYAHAVRKTTITGAATMGFIAVILYLMVLKPA